MKDDNNVTVPASLIDDLYYHFSMYNESRSRTSAAYHLTQLCDRVKDLATWHPGYDSETGTMPYERDDLNNA